MSTINELPKVEVSMPVLRRLRRVRKGEVLVRVTYVDEDEDDVLSHFMGIREEEDDGEVWVGPCLVITIGKTVKSFGTYTFQPYYAIGRYTVPGGGTYFMASMEDGVEDVLIYGNTFFSAPGKHNLKDERGCLQYLSRVERYVLGRIYGGHVRVGEYLEFEDFD